MEEVMARGVKAKVKEIWLLKTARGKPYVIGFDPDIGIKGPLKKRWDAAQAHQMLERVVTDDFLPRIIYHMEQHTPDSLVLLQYKKRYGNREGAINAVTVRRARARFTDGTVAAV
jgi:hypothetical protein